MPVPAEKWLSLARLSEAYFAMEMQMKNIIIRRLTNSTRWLFRFCKYWIFDSKISKKWPQNANNTCGATNNQPVVKIWTEYLKIWSRNRLFFLLIIVLIIDRFHVMTSNAIFGNVDPEIHPKKITKRRKITNSTIWLSQIFLGIFRRRTKKRMPPSDSWAQTTAERHNLLTFINFKKYISPFHDRIDSVLYSLFSIAKSDKTIR